MLRVEIKITENNSTIDNFYVTTDLTKYNIDRIYSIVMKRGIFDTFKIKFDYDTKTKVLKMFRPLTLTNIESIDTITIDFFSIIEDRELKLNQLLDE